MKTSLYAVTYLGGIIGAIILFFSLFASSAAQQGAGAAMAVAFVVIPYCMARVTEKSQEQPIAEAVARALLAHSQQVKMAQQATSPEPPIAYAPPRNPFAPKRS